MSAIRLVGIDVSGFRAFQHQFQMALRSPIGAPIDIVVIAGPNGTGKTSLLEAILLALGRESLIEQSLVTEVVHEHWRARVPDEATLALTFDVASAPGTELGPYTPCEVRLERTSRAWTLHRLDGQSQHLLSRQVLEAFIADLRVEYLSSWRAPFQIGGLRASAALADIPTEERYRYYRLKQRIINERSARGFSARDTRDVVWLARLNEVWSAWHDSADTRIDALETGDEDRPFDLFIVRETTLGPQPVCSLDMASSGELEWVTLAGLVIVEEFGGLLLIDEPELHLHPQWQARLLPTLRTLAPEAQIVVATHSPYPWDQALPFQRVLLLPPNDPRTPKAVT